MIWSVWERENMKKPAKKSRKELRGFWDTAYSQSATETGAAEESEASDEVVCGVGIRK